MDGVQTCALPICLQDLLNQIVINQKDLHLMFQNTQNINLQSFNSILEMQNLGFQATEENLKEIFSKMYEVRNHNLGLHQQLIRSEEHTSELQSLMRISYAVFCLKKKKQNQKKK